jgi:hypothetical protein
LNEDGEFSEKLCIGQIKTMLSEAFLPLFGLTFEADLPGVVFKDSRARTLSSITDTILLADKPSWQKA